MQTAAIDWSNWQADDHAVLCFVKRQDDVLMIRKRRGLGAGYITGPGGRIDPGETAEEAAVREVSEEVRLTVDDLHSNGQLSFQFTDGYKLHVHLFTTSRFAGEATETEEALPIWFHLDNLPFDEMWADDPLWLPLMLRGATINGRFVFDGKIMRWFHVTANDFQNETV